MGESQKFVAVVSPWEKLSDLVKKNFRVESLPAEKKVMVWRDDLQTEEDLKAELARIGIAAEIRTKKVIGKWQDLQ